MNKKAAFPKRKEIRLKSWDYSNVGAYFITICTFQKSCILSRITVGEGLAPPEIRLLDAGKIVEEEILSLENRFPTIRLDHYVIMPNHVHLLIVLSGEAHLGGTSPSATVTGIVGTMKSISARRCGAELSCKPLWQRSFYDHVIRNERDYDEIWNYIENNPARWNTDQYAADSPDVSADRQAEPPGGASPSPTETGVTYGR